MDKETQTQRIADFWEELIWVLSRDSLEVIRHAASTFGTFREAPPEFCDPADGRLLFEAMTDETLALAMHKDFCQKEAYEVLFLRYLDLLEKTFAKCLHRNGKDPDVQDLTLEFLSDKFYPGRKLIDRFAAHAGNSLRPYVLSSAKNYFNDWIGKRKEVTGLASDFGESDSFAVTPRDHDALTISESRQQLAKALERLSLPQYQVIERLLRQKKFDEIAAELNKSTSAVYLLKHKGVARLKELLPDAELADLFRCFCAAMPEICGCERNGAAFAVKVQAWTFENSNVTAASPDDEKKMLRPGKPQSVERWGQILEFRVRMDKTTGFIPIASENGSRAALRQQILESKLDNLLVGAAFELPQPPEEGDQQ